MRPFQCHTLMLGEGRKVHHITRGTAVPTPLCCVECSRPISSEPGSPPPVACPACGAALPAAPPTDAWWTDSVRAQPPVPPPSPLQAVPAPQLPPVPARD